MPLKLHSITHKMTRAHLPTQDMDMLRQYVTADGNFGQNQAESTVQLHVTHSNLKVEFMELRLDKHVRTPRHAEPVRAPSVSALKVLGPRATLGHDVPMLTKELGLTRNTIRNSRYSACHASASRFEFHAESAPQDWASNHVSASKLPRLEDTSSTATCKYAYQVLGPAVALHIYIGARHMF